MPPDDFTPYRQAGRARDLESKSLPLTVAPVWGAFLFEGLLTSARNPQRREHVLALWKADRIELIVRSSQYLDRIWALSRQRWPRQSRPEGVFEYEVVSAFGELLGYHLILNGGQLPSEEEADLVIQDLLDDFFQDDDGPAPVVPPQ
tara:strand:- start:5914 stop:6354 length:441 start_codon:yes stop_codon:yes gene_type:complete